MGAVIYQRNLLKLFSNLRLISGLIPIILYNDFFFLLKRGVMKSHYLHIPWLAICFIVFISMIPVNAHSEIYQDIDPLDTMGDLKARYSNAIYEKLNPDWAKETDILYQIRGVGIVGTIIVEFKDQRTFFKTKLDALIKSKNDKIDDKSTKASNKQDDPEIKAYQSFVDKTDEEALTVSWVRCVPDNPIPLQKFVTKYGKPDVSGFSDDGMQPYKDWSKVGIGVYLTKDGKNVLTVDYSFTKDDYIKAWNKKHPNDKGINPFLPDTKEKTEPSKKKQ
jgi:hypothetical protein